MSTLSSTKTKVALAWGDGIGPEIMQAVMTVLEAQHLPIEFQEVVLGEKAYLEGCSVGIPDSAWSVIRASDALLKGPLTTPQGKGYKSVNVTLRKSLGLFANVRPCVSLYPVLPSKHPNMNLVIVRENEEDLYGGIEHRLTPESVQCLKLTTQPGCERIIRYAFEYARSYGRKKVTCMTKDNIMKLTDGLFHATFDALAKEYPEIETDHLIIDIGTARVADTPEWFDVIVLPNLYGDILSDVAAQISGSVGLGASANIGTQTSMFEAIHGSAPQIAGQDIANPSGLLLSSVQMLAHLGLGEQAQQIHNAWLKTLEDGIRTPDIADSDSKKVGTQAFGNEVKARLGETPKILSPLRLGSGKITVSVERKIRPTKSLLGVDVFIDWDTEDRSPNVLAERLKTLESPGPLKLVLITNRGVKVWPDGFKETFLSDMCRCRFEGTGVTHADVVALLGRVNQANLDFVKTEHLYAYDGERGYSLGQGQ